LEAHLLIPEGQIEKIMQFAKDIEERYIEVTSQMLASNLSVSL